MKEYKVFIQRIGLLGVTNILLALSTLILLPILTKSFSITDYGIWVQINTLVTLIPNIAILGLPYTMVRFLSAEKDKNRIKDGFYSILIIIIGTNILISSLLLLFSRTIANLLFDGNIIIVQISAFIVFITCLDILLLNYFRTFQQIKKYSILSLIQTYIGVLLVSYLAILGFNVEIAAWGLFISKIVTFIIMAFIIISEIGISIPQFTNIKEYLSFGIPTIPGSLSFWIVESSDRFLIGILLGTAFVGYYAPGYTLGNIIVMFLSPFSLLLPAVLTKYYEENNHEKIMIFINYSMKIFLLIAIPTLFGMSFLSKPLLTLLTTPEIANQGYLVTPFVAMSATLFGIYGLIVNLIILEKKTRIIAIVWIIAAIMNLILNFILISPFGILGSAIATFISYAIAFVITLFFTLKNFDIKFDLKYISKCIFASIIMTLIIDLFNPKGLFDVILVISISILVYFAIMFIIKGFEKEDLKFLKKLISFEK